MFDRLHGIVEGKKGGCIILNVSGHGYRVETTIPASQSVSTGQEITLYTHLKVTDDSMKIYGFSSEKERDIFCLLIETVPAMGPVKAVSILSIVSAEELLELIEKEDIARLKAIKGIGDKVAARIIVELRARLPVLEDKKGPFSSKLVDVVNALVALGYGRREAQEAAQKLDNEDRPVEELVKKVLHGT
jgi:Holliday junction DNA helicase RuvA